jgi:pimeloyl-ACP methyl ester carboxylesterase
VHQRFTRARARRTAAVVALLLAAPAAALQWQVAAPEAPLGDSGVTVTRWLAPVDSDTIGLNRFANPATPADAIVLYLPGTNMNGQATITDERHNLWLFLANRGIAVFTLDYRSHFVAPDEHDLERLADWTADTYVADARHALEHIHAQHPELPVFVMGFSRGAGLAYGLACMAAPRIAGLVALDGGFKRPADDRPIDYATEVAHWRAQGEWADDVAGRRGWAGRQALMQAAIDGDAGDREALAGVLYNAWGPGRLANPDSVSDTVVLARLMIGYDRYYPSVQNLDGRAIAAARNAPHTPIDDCWGDMNVPILAVEAERFGGMVPGTRYSAEASGSGDVEVVSLPGFGHLDVLVARTAVEAVFEPVLGWLRARLR